MISALLLAAALPAAAQSPMPYSGDEPPAASTAPAVSTAAAVAASTETTTAVVTSTAGVKIGGGEKPKLARPMHAVIHPDSRDWEPVSLRAAGDPYQIETKAVLRLEKVRGRYRGAASKASARVRLHKAGDDRWLVVCVFPKALARRRMHIEARLKIVEGFVEELRVSLVKVVDPRPGAGAGLDSFELDARGVEYEEDSATAGALSIAALDPRPSRSAFNAGDLKRTSFGDTAVGSADVSWSLKGLRPAE
ncbi:MAG TPA: hypothetical protein VH309_05805 [Elusimicrobiota bacterium]|nr:hypothetical protein [Elusimicrobiota bacterium]